MAAFPGAVATFAGFTPGDTLKADNHGAQHNLEQAEIVALDQKVGTGASTPTANKVLVSTGIGTSAWSQVDLTTMVSGVLPIANGGTGGNTAAAAATNLASEIGKLLFPVGCVYTETTGVNPGTSLGFGTWTAFGAGRVLVGNGTSDQAFAAGATGGESNHTLTTAEMPSHTHTTTLAANATAGGTANYFAGNNSGSASPVTSSTGSDGAHNNLQPYIVVFFWKRTA